MLLVIDAGNTQTVVGLYGGDELLDHWRIATNAERTSDEHALLIGQFLHAHLDHEIDRLLLYDNPKEVGADRIADAVAAFDLYGGPAIVVDFGTATVFDAVSAKGEYMGGAIAPGIEISLDALFSRAAWLRRVELVEPPSVIGRSTVESIQSGVIYGFTGMVDGICRRIMDELGEAAVVATGGLSALIAPLSTCIQHEEPWLTLHGLRLIYEKNAGE